MDRHPRPRPPDYVVWPRGREGRQRQAEVFEHEVWDNKDFTWQITLSGSKSSLQDAQAEVWRVANLLEGLE